MVKALIISKMSESSDDELPAPSGLTLSHRPVAPGAVGPDGLDFLSQLVSGAEFSFVQNCAPTVMI